jgi:hypothetical protein
MRTQSLAGVIALSLGLMSVAATANAWERHGSRRHGGTRLGIAVNIAPYYRSAPVYCDGYWDSEYGCWDGDYGYSAYYRSAYPYVDTYYAPAPRVVVRYHNSRPWWRPRYHHRQYRHHR